MANCSRTSTGLIPFTDPNGPGLYPDGNNPPNDYLARGKELASEIVRRDATGKKSDTGSIGLLSIGMSNTKREFKAFMQLSRTKAAKYVKLVNGAQGAYDAIRVADPKSKYWTNINGLLGQRGLTAAQVQAVWIKEAVSGEIDPFPAHARELQGYLERTLETVQVRYPNVKLAFFSSRIYGGYASKQVSPEPWAYQGAYAVKWLIEDWMTAGEKKLMPFWGAYLWADGLKGRKADSLIWECNDVEEDGTHPTAKGQLKVANLLLSFFMGNELCGWFKG